MRSIARTLAAALPLLATMSAPIAAQTTNNVPIWLTTEADEDGSPLALFPLEGHPSLNQLTLMCGDRRGLTLRVSAKTVPGPSSVTIANAEGGKITLKPDGEGVVPAAGLNALRDLYERTTGMTGDDEPKGRVPFTITSGRETTKASYNFRRFGHTLVWMNQACADWRKPAATVATAPGRSQYAQAFIAMCQRGLPRQGVPGLPLKNCECQADTLAAYARQREPGLIGYPDMLMFSFVSLTDFMNKGGDRMGAIPHLQLAMMRFPDAAFTNMFRVMDDIQIGGRKAVTTCQ